MFQDHDLGAGHRSGIIESLKGLGASLLAIAQTRLELFSTEVEEQWIGIRSMLVWGVVTLFCAGVGVVLATLVVIFALWSSHPILALAVPAAIFLIGAGLAGWVLRKKAQAMPRFFSASLGELDKDRRELTSRS